MLSGQLQPTSQNQHVHIPATAEVGLAHYDSFRGGGSQSISQFNFSFNCLGLYRSEVLSSGFFRQIRPWKALCVLLERYSHKTQPSPTPPSRVSQNWKARTWCMHSVEECPVAKETDGLADTNMTSYSLLMTRTEISPSFPQLLRNVFVGSKSFRPLFGGLTSSRSTLQLHEFLSSIHSMFVESFYPVFLANCSLLTVLQESFANDTYSSVHFLSQAFFLTFSSSVPLFINIFTSNRSSNCFHKDL